MRRFLAPPARRWTLFTLAVALLVTAGLGAARACPPSCDDANPCTTDTCDAGTDTCVHVPVGDGTACSDSNACTTSDTCQAGVCVGGAAPNCDDGNPCTDDICDSNLGCLHADNNASCSDANSCTGCPAGTCGPVGAGDVCNGGTCVGGNTAPGCAACAAVATIPPLGGKFVGTTSGASGLAGSCGPTDTAPERVYRWIPETGGQATISTCGTGTAFDTVVYLRSGDCETGAEEACGDDTAGCTIGDGTARGSKIQPLVVADQPYYIVVDGKDGAAGAFTLTVKPPSVCGNNIREGLEQCDGTSHSGCCIGTVCQPCAADCTCTPPPDGLPDLVPELRDISVEFGGSVSSGDVAEGCAEQTSGLDLLHFTVISRNIGTADFYLGPSLCPSPCADHPLAVCANPEFICSPSSGHNHAHYTNFARYDLLDSDGAALVVGHKQGFCLLDMGCSQAKYICSNQGLTAGCWDEYNAALGCQYLDITGIPPGSYDLRVTIDPFHRISELDEANNVITVPVTIPVHTTTSTSTTSSSTSSSTSTTETSTTSSTSTSATSTSTSTTDTSTSTSTTSTAGTSTSSTSTTTSSSSSTTTSTTSTTTSTSRSTSSSTSTTSSTSSSSTSSTSSTTSTASSLPAPTTTTSTSTTLPPTDGCAAPIVVPPDGGVFFGATSGIGAQSGTCAPTGTAPERVYQWTPETSGVATIQTCSATETTFDTVLYLRETSCTAGTQVGCNDDTAGCAVATDGTSPGRGSRITPTVVAHHTYFIVVDGYSMAQGSFALTIVPPGTTPTTVTTSTLAPTTTSSTTVTSTTTTTTSTVPPGSCSAPVVLPAEGGSITAATKGTSVLAGTCAYTGAAPERVFRWTAPRSGVATIQTCSGKTNFDTVLYVRQTACTSGIQVSCNDDTQGCGTTLDGAFPHRGSKVTPTVTAGRTYFIVVDGYATARGTFQLTVSPPRLKTPVHRRAGAKVRLRVLRPSPPAQLR